MDTDDGGIEELCSLFDAPSGGQDPAPGGVESVEELLGLLAPPQLQQGGSASSSSAPALRLEAPAARASVALDHRRSADHASTGRDIVGADAEEPWEPEEPDLPEPTMEVPPEVSAIPFVISASFDLRCEVDVKGLAFGLRHAEYNPRKHSSITVRLLNPRTTALVRPSGKVSVVGKCNEDLIKAAAKKIARLVQRCGHEDAKFANFRVTSMYAKADLHFPIRLDKLASKWRRNALYEPEVYCGCVFKTRKPKCTYLVTAGGKVMIGGCCTMTAVNECLRRAYPVLYEFSS